MSDGIEAMAATAAPPIMGSGTSGRTLSCVGKTERSILIHVINAEKLTHFGVEPILPKDEKKRRVKDAYVIVTMDSHVVQRSSTQFSTTSPKFNLQFALDALPAFRSLGFHLFQFAQDDASKEPLQPAADRYIGSLSFSHDELVAKRWTKQWYDLSASRDVVESIHGRMKCTLEGCADLMAAAREGANGGKPVKKGATCVVRVSPTRCSFKLACKKLDRVKFSAVVSYSGKVVGRTDAITAQMSPDGADAACCVSRPQREVGTGNGDASPHVEEDGLAELEPLAELPQVDGAAGPGEASRSSSSSSTERRATTFEYADELRDALVDWSDCPAIPVTIPIADVVSGGAVLTVDVYTKASGLFRRIAPEFHGRIESNLSWDGDIQSAGPDDTMYLCKELQAFPSVEEPRGSLRVVVAYSETFVQAPQAYLGLHKLLMSSAELARGMNALTDDHNVLSQLLVSYGISTGTLVQLMEPLLQTELKSMQPSLLFRGNTIFTKFMDALLKISCRDVLFCSATRDVFDLVMDHCPRIEIDPLREPNEAEREANMERLIDLCDTFFSAVLSTAKEVPEHVRQAFRVARDAAQAKFPDEPDVAYSSVSSFFFLRYVCPAIVSPNAFGVFPHDVHCKLRSRALTLLAKVVQTAANLTRFGDKEAFMEPLNEVVDKHTPALKRLLEDVVGDPPVITEKTGGDALEAMLRAKQANMESCARLLARISRLLYLRKPVLTRKKVDSSILDVIDFISSSATGAADEYGIEGPDLSDAELHLQCSMHASAIGWYVTYGKKRAWLRVPALPVTLAGSPPADPLLLIEGYDPVRGLRVPSKRHFSVALKSIKSLEHKKKNGQAVIVAEIVTKSKTKEVELGSAAARTVASVVECVGVLLSRWV